MECKFRAAWFRMYFSSCSSLIFIFLSWWLFFLSDFFFFLLDGWIHQPSNSLLAVCTRSESTFMNTSDSIFGVEFEFDRNCQWSLPPADVSGCCPSCWVVPGRQIKLRHLETPHLTSVLWHPAKSLLFSYYLKVSEPRGHCLINFAETSPGIKRRNFLPEQRPQRKKQLNSWRM